MIPFKGSIIVAPKRLVSIINFVGHFNRAYCINIKKVNSKIQRDINMSLSVAVFGYAISSFVGNFITFKKNN